MKRIEKMAAPAGTLSVTTEFNVQAIAILNPTAYTISARLGGRDVPDDVESSDLYVPGGSLVVYPTIGTDFALGFTQPQAAFQPDGMPSTATIMFIGDGEVLPNFGAISLSTIDTRIVNPAITITQAEGTVFATDIATQTIDANIVNPALNVSGDVNVSGTVGAVITGSNVTLPISAAETLSVNFTNTQINATIQNASLAVTQQGTWAMNASITNANIAVTQSGAWNLNATITNAALTIQPAANSTFDIDIAQASINVPMRGAGTALLVTQFGNGAAVTNKILDLQIPSDIVGIAIINPTSYVTAMKVHGLTSQTVYFNVSDARDYRDLYEVFPITIPNRDTSVRITWSEPAAYSSIVFEIIGYRTVPTRMEGPEGATAVRQVPTAFSIEKSANSYDIAVTANSALSTVLTYDTQFLNYNVEPVLMGIYISSDGTTSAGQIRGIVEITTSRLVIEHRLVDWRSATTFQQQYIDLSGLRIERGLRIRLQRQNLDTVARRLTMFMYIELRTN